MWFVIYINSLDLQDAEVLTPQSVSCETLWQQAL